MKISVAMCTFNGARFLQEQLRSIGSQSRLPHEIVICDDGSTDATPSIVESFARSVSFPVRFRRNTANLGSTRNFEQAIRLCCGDTIALCDQDDSWVPEKLEIMAKLLERKPDIAGAFSDAVLIGEGDHALDASLWDSINFRTQEQKAFAADPVSFMLRTRVVTGAAFLFRARFVNQVTPIPQEWVHDAWIALILACLSRIEPVPEKLLRYRLHHAQQLGLRTVPKRVALQKGKPERVAFYRREAGIWSRAAEKLATLQGCEAYTRYAQTKAEYMRKRAALLEGNRLARIFKGATVLPGHFRHAQGVISYMRDFLHA